MGLEVEDPVLEEATAPEVAVTALEAGAQAPEGAVEGATAPAAAPEGVPSLEEDTALEGVPEEALALGEALEGHMALEVALEAVPALKRVVLAQVKLMVPV